MAASTAEMSAGHTFPRLHWGAVIAGCLLALAAHIVMGLIGAALGFAAAPSDSKAIGAAAAIWGLVTPFVATLLGAWLACRMASADDARSGYLHGVLVWCIGLIAGALFLAGTMATGAISAGTAASGNAGAAQRTFRAETGANRPSGPTARARADDAARTAAEGAGGGAIAALAGLLGSVVGAAISTRRRGRGAQRRFGTFFRHDETRAGMVHADDGRGLGTPYGTTTTTETRVPGTTTGLPREGELPPNDPYQH